jgi:hypothetical protein
MTCYEEYFDLGVDGKVLLKFVVWKQFLWPPESSNLGHVEYEMCEISFHVEQLSSSQARLFSLAYVTWIDGRMDIRKASPSLWFRCS